MLLRVDEFRQRTESDIGSLIAELQQTTSRRTQNEEKAWRSSLPKVAKAFSDHSFDSLHLFFGGEGSLALEYRMPGGNGWADLVLLGSFGGKPSAVVVELKHWDTRSDIPGPGEGLMIRHSCTESHPSDQVGGYVEWCSRFHSVIHDRNAMVNGCVLFTKDPHYHAYTLPPNQALSDQYPCFGLGPEDVRSRLPRFFSRLITDPDEDFAKDFVRGYYRQSKSFLITLGQQILDKKNSPFVLIDGQRTAYRLICTKVREAVASPGKHTIIVYGPPGSGKSVVGVRAWASLVSDPNLPKGSVVITTTSTCQYSNLTKRFVDVAGSRAARGVIIKATQYTPLSTHAYGRLRKQHHFKREPDWRDNLALVRKLLPEFTSGSRDDEFLVSFVDEAHALINPEHTIARGQHGFTGAIGPQAYHIMRSSRVSVFLLDLKQGFRQHENTTVDDIRTWARELGSEVTEVSLEDCQFRGAGSNFYRDFLTGLFGLGMADASLAKSSSALTQVQTPVGLGLEFRFFDSPQALEEALRPLVADGHTCRLVASYSRKWKTKKLTRPHAIPLEQMDFHEAYEKDGVTKYWSKIWNFAPRSDDYTHFVQAPIGSHMNGDPLCEVGCPYVVRNFDYDYVGLLWFSDLVWRKGEWQVNLSHCHEAGISRLISAAKKGSDENYQAVLAATKAAYRILLSRSMKGIYIWCEDRETREFLGKSFGVSS